MKSQNSSALLALLGDEVIHASSGMTPEELSYLYIVTESSVSVFNFEDTLGVCAVELPFVSGVHLVGVPTNISVLKWHLRIGNYEAVELEGNFNNIFSLFAEPRQQSQARYVLDPAAMVFVMDFCSKYVWEIIDDTLYFVSENTVPTLDTVDEFVRQIRPAIEVPSDRARNPAKLPYTNGFGRKLHCPRCAEKLVLGRAWMACPNGHGFLLSGSQLIDERESSDTVEYDPAAAAQNMIDEHLTCPYCGGAMQKNRYQTGNLVIDVCTQCPHRWLDGPEIKPIIG